MTFLEMENQSETNEYSEFLLKMSLVYFIVSIVGFLMFAVLLIYYITCINMKKVDTVSKFIIGILFAFNVS
jgi:Ca2+/Na+ antiporter